MLSGIGPADQLRRHGIDVVQDLAGVGRNYQDHMEMSLVYRLGGPHSYDKYKKLHWQAWAALQYALFRSGPITSNIIEAGAFWWSGLAETHPDLQLFFLAGAGIEEGVDTVPGGNGCTISVTQARPRSVGYVELASPDPAVPPLIAPRYLTHPDDIRCLMDGARLVQDIMQRPSIAPLLDGPHVPPRALHTDAEWEDFVRREAHAALHPCGTCRMGTDREAVVDPSLRVRGVAGLRVVDASIMPNIVSGNLNAVAIMIGEKAADIISGRPALTAEDYDEPLAHRLARQGNVGRDSRHSRASPVE